MRVLIFGWEFPPFKAGGLATATLNLVKGLLQNQVGVTLVVPFPIYESPIDKLRLISTTRRMKSLKVRRVASLLTPYLSAQAYDEMLHHWVQGTTASAVYGRDIFAEVERFAAIAGDIAAEEPHDVINAHDWMAYAAGIQARHVSGKPLVVHIHATEIDRSGDGVNQAIYQRELVGMRAADLIIANSKRQMRLVSRTYGISPDKIDVIPWGLDEEWAASPKPTRSPFPGDEKIVLFVGRVTRQKGPDYFIEMAARVAAIMPKVHFIVAGGGDMLPRIVERAVELGLQQRVHFTGPLDGAHVLRVMRLADICVMPSVSEPFGLVPLESLKSGTPCLISRDAGVSEVLHNVFKVDFWDIEEMTNKVVSFLKYPVLQAEMEEKGYQEVVSPRFGLSEPARRTQAAFQRAIEMKS